MKPGKHTETTEPRERTLPTTKGSGKRIEPGKMLFGEVRTYERLAWIK